MFVNKLIIITIADFYFNLLIKPLLLYSDSYLTPEYLIHDGETTGTDKAHVLMGIVFFSFMLLQTILGVLINLFKEDPRKAALIIITKKIHLVKNILFSKKKIKMIIL
jgi:hypothetical protein